MLDVQALTPAMCPDTKQTTQARDPTLMSNLISIGHFLNVLHFLNQGNFHVKMML